MPVRAVRALRPSAEADEAPHARTRTRARTRARARGKECHRAGARRRRDAAAGGVPRLVHCGRRGGRGRRVPELQVQQLPRVQGAKGWLRSMFTVSFRVAHRRLW